MTDFITEPVGSNNSQWLWVFAIARRPRDFPRHWTVRPFVVRCGEPVPHAFACLCESLEEARSSVPEWADQRIPAAEGDDPVIVETWL